MSWRYSLMASYISYCCFYGNLSSSACWWRSSKAWSVFVRFQGQNVCMHFSVNSRVLAQCVHNMRLKVSRFAMVHQSHDLKTASFLGAKPPRENIRYVASAGGASRKISSFLGSENPKIGQFISNKFIILRFFFEKSYSLFSDFFFRRKFIIFRFFKIGQIHYQIH